ncbi:MAG: hypothetical protein NZ805_14060 [Armatimonadetes bacterium]|nr:hypothetical protein [Armatimonadota bacterium]
MRKELPVWIVAIVVIVVLMIIGTLFWRATKPLPEIAPTPQQEAMMEAAKERAFRARTKEELEKMGSKIVPSPYAPKQR